MAKIPNYYKMMKSGLYRVVVDRMALFDKSNAHRYIYPTGINHDGELVTITNEPEFVETAISILGMIVIHKKGYPIDIRNINNIKEIVEIIYNHISACIEVKRNNPLQEFTVNVDDLVDMEEFMISILEANPITMRELCSQEFLTDMKRVGLISMFDEPTLPTEEETKTEVDVFRRITRMVDVDITMDELLNTL